MKDSWVCVYSSKWIYQVEIIQALLTDNSINSVIVNKQDSSYFFGEIELHVNQDDVMQAIQIIKKENL